MKVIDLTHTIAPGMPLYPGTKPPKLTTLCTIKKNGFIEKRISLTSHTGTHIDAPAHIIYQGKALDQWPIDHFAGPASVLNFTDLPTLHIELEILKLNEPVIKKSEFVLLHTGWSRYWGEEKYFTGYPVLTPEAAQWLVNFQLKGVGMDTISADEPGTDSLLIHNILLAQEIVIIENLVHLDRLPPTGFTFCCFPLKLADSEASPIRAAGIVFN